MPYAMPDPNVSGQSLAISHNLRPQNGVFLEGKSHFSKI